MPEARIARLEACFARLDALITAAAEARKDWKIEVERRLDELNGHAKQAEHDRDELLSKETYEGRHGELAKSVTHLGERLDMALRQHERDDDARHKEDGNRIHAIEEFVTGEKASVETRREATVRSRWVFGAIITIANLLLYLFLHFTVGLK